ncbi:MAG: small multidrug export protein [Lachnospiraceae bacterium]|nr:small multidrug export protein [Lachnospiraceae bacterium]
MKYLIMFIISMVPLIELRGAVPYGLGMNLNPLWVYAICIFGNMLPVPFIYFFARKVLEWGKDKPIIGGFFTFCLEKGEKGGQKLQEKAGRGLFVALFLFVGIPLPGTGAWTGTLAASILDMDFKSSIAACMCGVILAGIIMGLASMGLFSLIGLA